MSNQSKRQYPIIDARVRLPDEFRPTDKIPDGIYDRYDVVLGIKKKLLQTFDDLCGDMDSAGVDAAIMHSEYEFGDSSDALNEAVANLVTTTKRFEGVGTIRMPPAPPGRAVKQVQRLADLGLVGINIQPSFFDLDMDDRLLYPAYAAAEALGLTMCVHTGINYSRSHRMDHETPSRLDRVAGDFPDLRLIACHAGWPWVTDMVAVARRHPTVYLEFGGLAPKYVDAPDTGWAVLRRMMRSTLQRQVLFATDWPVMPHSRCVDEWGATDLTARDLKCLFSANVQDAFPLADFKTESCSSTGTDVAELTGTPHCPDIGEQSTDSTEQRNPHGHI